MQRLWEPERVVEASVACELIREQFPQLHCATIEILGIGWDNTAYLVDAKWVFRFPRRQIAVELLEREAHALPLIAKHASLKVTVPLFVGKPSSKYDWPFAGYEVIKGETADRCELDDGGRSELTHPLAAFLRCLHSIDVDQGRQVGLREDTLGKLNLEKWLPRCTEHLQQFERDKFAIDFGPLRQLLTYLKRTAPSDQALHVVHGDFYVRHLVLDYDQCLGGIIDWGDVHLSSPAVDLSILYTFLPAGLSEQFALTYGEISENQRLLAMMRALVYGCNLLNYSRDIGDEVMVRESLWMLNNVATAATTEVLL